MRYDFKCENCNETFEESSNFLSPAPFLPCPKCGKDSKRIISIPNIQFKADGFTKKVEVNE